MDNDNLKTFRVSPLDGSPSYIVEALGFEVEADTAATIFYDADDKLVARLFNVSVAPASASRESSAEMVALAQAVLAMPETSGDDEEYRPYNSLLEKAKSLAGSVLSQAGKD